MSRKGFTLVELLIVIVVIGVLSAMMMLSSTEAITSAKVSNIVSNLRNLKTAALAYYADNYDYFSDPKNVSNALDVLNGKKVTVQDIMKKYLGHGKDHPDMANYAIKKSSNNGNSWWVLYEIKGSASEVAKIKKKLAGRAKSLGLKGTEAGVINDLKYIPKDFHKNIYTNQDTVALQVR